jgi:hypothetical protein
MPRAPRLASLLAFSVVSGVLYAHAALWVLRAQGLNPFAWAGGPVLYKVGAVFGLASSLYVLPLLWRTRLARAMAFVAVGTLIALVPIIWFTWNPLLVCPFHAVLCAMADRRYRIVTPPDRCPRCGYDLRGIDADACPECGGGRPQGL